MDFQSELTVTRHYTPRQYGFTFTNGIQASLVEVDPDTGFVKLLKHWCVEDSGTVINPMLVDEQLRGGVVQGIGAALYEECLYGPDGQLLNGNMADYLVPMSGEMPDIVCAHVETPTMQSQLGAKGIGEAGTAGAPAAVMNAVNDALAPLERARHGDAVYSRKNSQGIGKSLKDSRVSSAISHWAPRFVSNGVLLADFEEVTGSLERWEDWCAAWSKRAAMHEGLGRESLSGRLSTDGGRAPRPRRDLLPLRQVRVCPGPGADARRAHEGGRLLQGCLAPDSPAGGVRGNSV